MAFGEVLLPDERGNQRLVGRPSERLGAPRHKRERQDVPDLHVAQQDEPRQGERRRHLDDLRGQQQLPPVVTVRDNAADEGEQQDRQLAKKCVEGEVLRRVGQLEHQPVLRDLLHPVADAGCAGAHPQHAEIAVGQRRAKTPEATWWSRQDDSGRVGNRGRGLGGRSRG